MSLFFVLSAVLLRKVEAIALVAYNKENKEDGK
jgi:hypothetical protein